MRYRELLEDVRDRDVLARLLVFTEVLLERTSSGGELVDVLEPLAVGAVDVASGMDGPRALDCFAIEPEP
jgi:hypothetical protein